MNNQINGRWRSLLNELRIHWPDITDNEFINTQGGFTEILQLITKHDTHRSKEELTDLLDELLDMTSTGNPNSIDDFSGIDYEQIKGPKPPSNEWEARENQNK